MIFICFHQAQSNEDQHGVCSSAAGQGRANGLRLPTASSSSSSSSYYYCYCYSALPSAVSSSSSYYYSYSYSSSALPGAASSCSYYYSYSYSYSSSALSGAASSSCCSSSSSSSSSYYYYYYYYYYYSSSALPGATSSSSSALSGAASSSATATPAPTTAWQRKKKEEKRKKVLCSDHHTKCLPSSAANAVVSKRAGSEKRHVSVSMTISAPTLSSQCPAAEAPQSLSSSLETPPPSAPTRCTIYRRKLRVEKDRELLARGSDQQSQPGGPCDFCGEPRHINSGHAYYKGQYFCSVEDKLDLRTPQEWLMEQQATNGLALVPRTTAWRKRKKEEGEAEGEGNPPKRKKSKIRICQRCGQPAAKEYGHSQYNGKDKKHYYCALYEGTDVDLWLALRRREDSQQQEEEEE